MLTTYANVLSTLSADEIHRCFICLEVIALGTSQVASLNAAHYMADTADKYGFDQELFDDIIDEEYMCTYDK